MIRVQNLVKHFGSKRAVNGVSFSVDKGQVLAGFVGSLSKRDLKALRKMLVDRPT